ncbi:hypothetical protein FKM82_026908 [Ascaphus truei]
MICFSAVTLRGFKNTYCRLASPGVKKYDKSIKLLYRRRVISQILEHCCLPCWAVLNQVLGLFCLVRVTRRVASSTALPTPSLSEMQISHEHNKQKG